VAVSREPSTPINRAALDKQSIAFVDGRLLPLPAINFACAMFTPGTTSLYFLLGCALTYALARFQFLRWPWLIDDIEAEIAYHFWLPDIGDDDE
jgi:hypothetical protein